MPLHSKNRVVVYVWTSKENKQFPGDNVGHVAIQTPEKYISLWPSPFTAEEKAEYRQSDKTNRKKLSYFGERAADFHQSYAEDFAAEGDAAAQVILCFYSLDQYEIINEFERLKKKISHWRLIGSNLLMQNVEKILESSAEALTKQSKIFESPLGIRHVESCASLALKLLKAGGLSKLIDDVTYSTVTTKTSTVVKPDDVLYALMPAKLKELEFYPETKDFKHAGETSPEAIQPKSTFSCRIS